MKSILLNIKNILPYLILVVIYFFFVNIEASRNNNYNKLIEKEKDKNQNESNIMRIDSSIIIPVIPYEE